MELTQLKQFKVIAETENITKASEILFISQSALSQMLSKLENELDCKLFDRKNQRIYLNDNGKKALYRINNVLNELDILKSEVSKQKRELKIASESPSSLWIISRTFIQNFPDIVLNPILAEQNELKNMLETNQIDAAFSLKLIKDASIYQVPFSEIRTYITVDKSHPLAKYDSVSLKDLSGYDHLAINDKQTFMGMGTAKIVSKYNLNVHTVYDLNLYYDTLMSNPKYITFSNNLEIKYKSDIYEKRKILKIKDSMPRYTLYLQYLKENNEKIEPIKNLINESYSNFAVYQNKKL